MGPKVGDTGLVDSGLHTLRPGGRGVSGQDVCVVLAFSHRCLP